MIPSVLSQCISGSAVLRKRPGAELTGNLEWNRLGIRDPSFLLDNNGMPVLDEAGRVSLFFNARNCATAEGGTTCVGVARGNAESGWSIQPKPVFVDGSYAAQGSVLQLAPDHFRMYYSPDTLGGFSLASSCDGNTWQKFDDKLILTPEPFGIRRMGLPFVRWVMDQWVMLFEGVDNGRFHIYLAYSADGINWIPGNMGKPVYLPEKKAWDSLGQANPSLYFEFSSDNHSSFYILYNGCSESHGWDLGVLVSESLEGPWSGLAEPVLRRGKKGEWDAGRLEGARLLERSGRLPEIFFFGLPTEDSYSGGQIAAASIEQSAQEEVMEIDSDRNAEAERIYNDKLALKYFEVWDNYPIQQFTTQMESRLMDVVIRPSSRVVLLGSGGGREIPALLAKGCHITAVDISPQMLAVGRERYPHANLTWHQADLHDLPPNLGKFDAAICLGAVFNYLRDPELFLSNVRSCLKPGGAFILAVINANHPSEPKTLTKLSDGRVRQLYSLSNLEMLLESAGFRIFQSHGLRFFADFLPTEWNRSSAGQAQTQILNDLLAIEGKLSSFMSAEKAKFILIHSYHHSTYCYSS